MSIHVDASGNRLFLWRLALATYSHGDAIIDTWSLISVYVLAFSYGMALIQL